MAPKIKLPRPWRRKRRSEGARDAAAADAPTTEIAAGESAGGRAHRLRRAKRPLGFAAAGLLLLGAGVAAGYALFDEGEADAPPAAVAPTVVVGEAPAAEAAEEIGFPAFATLNTTRVGGSDPIADAAGVALAASPSAGGVPGPPVVTIAPADSWQAALASSVLVADPVGAPVLLGTPGEIPGFTAEAIAGLGPTGSQRADGAQIVAVGDVAAPDGLKTVEVKGREPAAIANEIDQLRARLSGRKSPENILVVPARSPEYAMPAAAWSARSGDPIVFADGDDVPEATLDVLKRHENAGVYVLGPASAIGDDAIARLRKISGPAVRIGAEDPVASAVEFARFVDGGFGWNINDPGHGFTIANTSRPSDAAAAAPLAASGKPGPLLVTDDADEPPAPLRSFLLDTKPGFSDDPTRAIYNHVWLIGDTSAMSVDFQAQIDELTALERVRQGSGRPDFVPGAPEPESEPDTGGRGRGPNGR